MAQPILDPEEALAGPLYFVAALLCVMPVIDFVMSIGSPQPGNVQWRFATVGLLSGYTLTPILGVAIAMGVATAAEHAKVQRVLAWLSLIAAIGLLILLAGFALDVIQLRASIPADGQAAFRSASGRAALKHVLAASAFWYLGWRARRMIPQRAKQKPPKTVHIVTK
ncbi:MAG TPA: hypothetical protein VF981_11380 [Gemmatimonadaceae bacterium]|jgi:hypothetical protein